MFRNYFITAIRYLTKNSLFTTINTIGLAASFSCSLLIYLYVRHELTYDEFHNDIDRLYVLGEGSREDSPDEAAYYQTVYPALPALLEEFPEIETGTRYFDWDTHILSVDDKRFMHRVLYTDNNFLQTFTFPLEKGNAGSALEKPGQIVLSQDVAMTVFNTTDVLGKIVTLDGEPHTVTGVMAKIPANSTIQPQVLLSLTEKEKEAGFDELGNWYNTIAQVVIKVRPDADVKGVNAKLTAFVKRHYDPAAKERMLKLYPFADLRQSEARNQTLIYGLTTIGVFILLIAVINFMNLSIATSLRRLRETGLRKVMGSSRNSIVLQFFLESFLLTVMAMVISVGMLELVLPLLNMLLGLSLTLGAQEVVALIAPCFGLALVIGLVAGGYPALYLSNYKTVNAVKGIIPNHRGKISLRNALVIVQFVVSVTLIIGVIVTSRQIRYMKSADLKFNRDNVLVVSLDAGFRDPRAASAGLERMIHELRQRTDVASVSFSQNVPGRYWENYNGFIPEGGSEAVSLRQANVDEQYLPTYGIKIIEGRNFSREMASDTLNKVMINAAALKALGWTSATGKTLTSRGTNQVFTVIGVFDDFHYRSLKGAVQPLIHFYGNKIENASLLSLKLTADNAPAVISFIEREWKKLDAWLGLDYFFIDEEFDTQYRDVERTLLLIGFFTGIAIVISCAGIFALSAIAAQQRTKEIGIRKVLGASLGSVVGLLSKDFLTLVLVSMLLAVPLAWYAMSMWLSDFAYRIELQWWIFVTAGGIALVIAFITTGLQSVRAALQNPVDSLHND